MKPSDRMRESASVRHTISADEYGAGKACQIIEAKDEKLLKAADLLDECEQALEDIMYWTENTHATANQIAVETLADLRAAQEKEK